MPDNNYFEQIPDGNKRDLAFNVVASVREAVSIAQKKGTPPTYEQALQIIHDVDPSLYQFCSNQLQNKNENELAKLFKDKAVAASLKEGRNVTAEELLEKEIEEHRDLINHRQLEGDRKKSIKGYIMGLEAALENLRPRRLTEHRILERDFIKVDRSQLGAEQLFTSDNYVDYKLASNRFLRIRILHPDKPEHIIGADLIYERYNMNTEMVRIAVLQYKVWEDNGVLYFGGDDNRALGQMKKLHDHFCDVGMCNQGADMASKVDFRFPYCCAFLRPTDRMQDPDSRMISSGIHIPICSALEMVNEDKKIEKAHLRHTALTHEVFEHLFNHSFVGSRAMPFQELEAFYKDLEVLDGSRTLKVYAKEVLMKRA
jgi:hypothetical protein